MFKTEYKDFPASKKLLRSWSQRLFFLQNGEKRPSTFRSQNLQSLTFSGLHRNSDNTSKGVVRDYKKDLRCETHEASWQIFGSLWPFLQLLPFSPGTLQEVSNINLFMDRKKQPGIHCTTLHECWHLSQVDKLEATHKLCFLESPKSAGWNKTLAEYSLKILASFHPDALHISSHLHFQGSLTQNLFAGAKCCRLCLFQG